MTNESKTSQYYLIRGEFTPEEARRVLMTLINDKIKFHQMNNLGHEERYGYENPASIKRIEELSQTRNALAELIDAAGQQGSKLRINSRIDVELEHPLASFEGAGVELDSTDPRHLI